MGRERAGYAAVAHLYIGAYDQHQGKPEDAIEHYKEVLSLAQSFAAQNVYANLPPVLTKVKAAALGNMGEAYYNLRNYAAAKDSFEAGLASSNKSPATWPLRSRRTPTWSNFSPPTWDICCWPRPWKKAAGRAKRKL